MGAKKKKIIQNQAIYGSGLFSFPEILNYLPSFFLALTLFLAPLFPDEKLNRLKLICLGGGLICTAFLWAITKLGQSAWIFYHTPADPFLLLYLIVALLYYKASQNPAVASSEFQRMVFSVGAYFVVVQVCSGEYSQKLRKIVLVGWLAGLFLVSLYGILQHTGGIGRIMVPQMDRVFGTFGNATFFSAFLVLSIPITLGALFEFKKLWTKVLLFLIFSLACIALFYTKTRAAYLALSFSFLFFFLSREITARWHWTRWFWKFKWRLTILFLLFSGTSLYLSRNQNLKQKTQTFLQTARVTTVETHTLIWKDVLKMWLENKWFGTGFGTFHIEFPQYASEELKKVFPQEQRIVNDAHNEYLQILAEQGLVGFLVFSALLAAFFFASFRFFFSSEHMPNILFAGILSGIFGLLIHNFFSVDMRFIVSSTYLFLAMGIGSSFFATAVSLRWENLPAPFLFKTVWATFFVLLAGLLGINRNGFFLLGIWKLEKDSAGTVRLTKTAAAGPGLLPALLRPYLSQKVLAQTPDFFDEKLLNAAQTIRDLETLTQQYPDQWRTWEKLGFALAKEIQRKTADGRKVNDLSVAARAIAAYKKAYELNPKAEGPPNNLGNIYFTLNQRDEAMEWWKKAIAANPEKIDARLNLGIAYYYQGKIKESAQQFEEVLKLDPKNEKAIVMLRRMVE